MAKWQNLKTAISAVIRENGTQEITGSALQTTLLNMVTQLGENYMFAGVATPALVPGSPDGNIFYMTSEVGTYTGFNNIEVVDGEIAILLWNGAWAKQSIAVASKAEIQEVNAKLEEMQKGMEDVYAYGVEWDSSVADPTFTRIGNMTLHRSLPIQSQLKGCVANQGVINYYLNPGDWSKKEDGTPSILDGTDGTVRVHVPRFWGKSGVLGTKRWVKISSVCIDDTWTEIPEMLIDAYRGTTDTTTSTIKLVSVVNTTEAFRGGGRRADYDKYLETDVFRTDLGKPRTAITRATARTYANNAGAELLNYEYYKWIMFWLPVIEYATFNMQANFNPDLTADGFHQGGLSAGITNMSNWTEYNGYYSICPCGYANELGNFTGTKKIDSYTYDVVTTGRTSMAAYTKDTAAATMANDGTSVKITNVLKANTKYLYSSWMYQSGETVYTVTGLAEGQTIEFYTSSTIVATATADGDITVNWPVATIAERAIRSQFTGACDITLAIKSASTPTVTPTKPAMYVARYRGFENIFGDIWTNMEGIIIQGYQTDGAYTHKNVYTTTNPEDYGETETQKAKMKLISSQEIHQDGYIKDFDLQTTGEIVPSVVGGGSTTYMCDYHYTGSKDSSLRTLLLGGRADDGGGAGLGCFASNAGVGYSGTGVGFRTINKIEN